MKCAICKGVLSSHGFATIVFCMAPITHTLNICGPCLRRKIGNKGYDALFYDAVKSGWAQMHLPF
jgi:hypothetical protein